MNFLLPNGQWTQTTNLQEAARLLSTGASLLRADGRTFADVKLTGPKGSSDPSYLIVDGMPLQLAAMRMMQQQPQQTAPTVVDASSPQQAAQQTIAANTGNPLDALLGQSSPDVNYIPGFVSVDATGNATAPTSIMPPTSPAPDPVLSDVPWIDPNGNATSYQLSNGVPVTDPLISLTDPAASFGRDNPSPIDDPSVPQTTPTPDTTAPTPQTSPTTTASGSLPFPLPQFTIPTGTVSQGGSQGGGVTYDESGNPVIGNITLPSTPLESSTYDPALQDFFNQLMGSQAANIGSYYDQGNWPTMQAAQLDLSQIPNITAPQVAGNDALSFLLSGKGFDDATMSLLRGQSTDAITRAGVSQRANDKLLAQRSGLADSGSGVALESQDARRTNDAVASALNQLSIQNAQQGLQNLTTGAGLDLTRQSNNANLSMQAALQNAANLFAGMQQNVSNVQQTAGVNTGNQQAQQMARAGAQTANTSQLGSLYGQSALNRADTADQTNISNLINRGLNQAQLDRQADTTNAGTANQNFNNALQAYLGLINGSNAAQYNTAGASAATSATPNLGYANAFTNLGQMLASLNNGATHQ